MKRYNDFYDDELLFILMINLFTNIFVRDVFGC